LFVILIPTCREKNLSHNGIIMKNNYFHWHELKSSLSDQKKDVFFRERDVWFCHLGFNLGSEQNGIGKNFVRPVLILKKFNLDTFYAIPLTSKQKEGRFYFSFSFKEKESTALLSQIRLLDRKRLDRKFGVITQKDFSSLQKKISGLLFSKSDPPG